MNSYVATPKRKTNAMRVSERLTQVVKMWLIRKWWL